MTTDMQAGGDLVVITPGNRELGVRPLMTWSPSRRPLEDLPRPLTAAR